MALEQDDYRYHRIYGEKIWEALELKGSMKLEQVLGICNIFY